MHPHSLTPCIGPVRPVSHVSAFIFVVISLQANHEPQQAYFAPPSSYI